MRALDEAVVHPVLDLVRLVCNDIRPPDGITLFKFRRSELLMYNATCSHTWSIACHTVASISIIRKKPVEEIILLPSSVTTASVCLYLARVAHFHDLVNERLLRLVAIFAVWQSEHEI